MSNTPKGKYSYVFRALLTTFSLFWAGCLDHAPRDHPLDPLGEAFENTGTISGKITGLYAPFEGISGIDITLSPGGIFTRTSADGTFTFSGVEEGSYILEASRILYATLSDTITIEAGDIFFEEYPLNALPHIDSLSLNAVAISRWWPPPLDYHVLEIEVQAMDLDGLSDIDRVWIEVSDLNYSDTLLATETPGKYRLSVREDRLPAPLATFQGLDHIIYLRDRSGRLNASPTATIHRVIDQTPLALDPIDLEVISIPELTFVWEPVQLPYPFTFRIDVVRVDDNLRNMYLTRSGIPSDSLSLTIPSPQLAGEYFWTVSVVDGFGNRSRSREAGFLIP